MKDLCSKLLIIILGFSLLLLGCELGMAPALIGSDGTIESHLPETEMITGPEFNSGDIGSRAVANSPYFKVTQSGDRYRVDVNLQPGGYTYYEGAIVEVRSTSSASGWRVNIGNSPTNNGYGGDAGTTKYDSELQLLNQAFSLYRNDYGGSGLLRSVSNWGNERKYKFQIENNYILCRKYNLLGIQKSAFALKDAHIFNFNSSAGYTFHVGVNQTITSARYGTGMSGLTITLIKPKTGVYLVGNSVANYPGAYTLGHMGLVVGSDTNSMGWHFFSIERDNSPYIQPAEIIWKTPLPAIATGSVSGGAEYSVLYHHQEATREALFSYLEKNAPGVNNSGSGIIVGQGYDRIALLERYDYAQAKNFLAFVKAYPPFTYSLMDNNCATFSTYAIEDYYDVECNDNSWHVPNHLFDDLYANSNFTIVRDDRIDQ